MGGYGSGLRICKSKKDAADELRSIDINGLMRQQGISVGQSSWGFVRWLRGDRETGSIEYHLCIDPDDLHVLLVYTYNKTESVNHTVPLVTTRPYFGGLRYGFICTGCNRRVGKLYAGGNYFSAGTVTI